MHDVLVVDPLSHFLQQPVMPDIVKVGSQIKVEDPRLPLSYCFRHSLDRVVCCPLGPISIRPRLEVRLEHRFEDELERTLHHSVPDRSKKVAPRAEPTSEGRRQHEQPNTDRYGCSPRRGGSDGTVTRTC